MQRQLRLLWLLTIVGYLLSFIGVVCINYAKFHLTRISIYLTIETIFTYYEKHLLLTKLQLVGKVLLIFFVISYVFARRILPRIGGDGQQGMQFITRVHRILPLVVIGELILGYCLSCYFKN